MTKGIKVWVVVRPNGILSVFTSNTSEHDALVNAAFCVGAASKLHITPEWLISIGYTVEPCTLTKGHGNE